ncbi:MAG: CRISPR-associated endonuclease Cas1 [Actinomycetota bacterium]|nr:CRISPR-associated endonuclease Cas1 [Actinomycetota bacterium]
MDSDLLPARMVNEFVFCPRLFYLEWVDTRWADNDDTRLGQQVHRKVDVESGAAPLPEDGELRRARSVTLSSERLGVIAKLDLIEGDGGSVVPVDYKKGSPQPDGTPWPSDEVQVCLQALLLRERGYQCDHAELWYAEIRQRVRVELTPERLSWAADLIADARAVADRARPPLPLVDSPKCPRCSLVGLCLPDETNALLARREQPPRRLLPRDPDQRPVYVTEPGAFVGVRSGRLEVTLKKEKLASWRLLDVAQLAVFGRVQISTQALGECFARGIPVLWLSSGGWLQGFALGQPSKYVELRRQQTVAHAQGGTGLAQQMIAGKILNCRTLLRRNSRGDVSSTVAALKRLAQQAREAANFSSLLGIEGTAARMYFGALPSMLADVAEPFGAEFSQLGRNRRPPPDPLNALLSFCYSMLAKDLVAVTLGVGFDPYLGVYHRSRYGRPSLALDLAEEFRPLIADSVVIALLNNREITPSDFIRRAGAVSLTADGRRTVLRAYERRLDTEIRHPVFAYRISYRRVLDVQARLLAAVLVGEIPEYLPMVTR